VFFLSLYEKDLFQYVSLFLVVFWQRNTECLTMIFGTPGTQK
jgi:hypothetical protein